MKSIVHRLFHRLPGSPLRPVRRFRRDPVDVQRKLLRTLLRRAADTEWGRRYGFREIAEAPDVVTAYQSTVPLSNYDAIHADVERVRADAEDVMWPGRFEHFAVSSGTASSGKIIPVSREMLARDRAFSIGAGVNYLAESGDPRFLFGKHLTLPGRIEEDPQHPGTMIGEVSGLVAEAVPAFFRTLFQAVSNEVAFRPNWEEKLRAIARRTARQDVRLTVMAPTWALVLFDRLLEEHHRRTGERARTIAEVWPHYQVFFSGGVPLKSYRRLIREKVGRPIDFVETYGASEGFFSFQDRLDDPAMLLHLANGVFFEFVRMDALNTERPRRYWIRDVEPDVRYALYVTSCSGLWSYAVGDVVRFTQTFPHKILVAGRTSEMIDKYGEAVFGEEARTALRKACEATGAHLTDFHVAPRVEADGRLPGLEWLVEFETPPRDLGTFADVIDDYLQAINRHYQIRREAGAFDGPEVTPLPQGAFYAWLREEKGEVSGQTKVPRMSEERRVAEGVLRIVRTDPSSP